MITLLFLIIFWALRPMSFSPLGPPFWNSMEPYILGRPVYFHWAQWNHLLWAQSCHFSDYYIRWVVVQQMLICIAIDCKCHRYFHRELRRYSTLYTCSERRGNSAYVGSSYPIDANSYSCSRWSIDVEHARLIV